MMQSSGLDFKIFPMTPKDIPILAQLESICFSTPWSEESFESELKNPKARFTVAKIDNNILGYIGCHNICGEGYITNIAVFPEYRNHKVADTLLKDLCIWGKQNKLEFITLEVRESNDAAIRLYKNNGFSIEGVRKNFYTKPLENGLIMTRFEKPTNI